MVKDVVTVWQCECRKNIVVLDENMQGLELTQEEILCPTCGNEMVSECSRDMTLGSIRDNKEAWDKVLEIKNRLKLIEKKTTKQYNEDVAFLLSLLDE